LIDREADLLIRGVKDSNLDGLRRRISILFLQYIKTPSFNPEAARYLKVSVSNVAHVGCVECLTDTGHRAIFNSFFVNFLLKKIAYVQWTKLTLLWKFQSLVYSFCRIVSWVDLYRVRLKKLPNT